MSKTIKNSLKIFILIVFIILLGKQVVQAKDNFNLDLGNWQRRRRCFDS